jgi:DNA-directed RNA polymerase subunit K/omega
MMTTKEAIEQIRNESMKYAKVAIEELLAGETTTTEEEEKKVS